MTQLLPNMVFYILHQPLKSHNYELISDVCVCVLHDYAHIRYSIELVFKKGLSGEAVPPHLPLPL